MKIFKFFLLILYVGLSSFLCKASNPLEIERYERIRELRHRGQYTHLGTEFFSYTRGLHSAFEMDLQTEQEIRQRENQQAEYYNFLLEVHAELDFIEHKESINEQLELLDQIGGFEGIRRAPSS